MDFLSIGVVREIKPGEDRVGLTPRGVKAMTKFGIPVLVQKGAGKGSRFHDLEYAQAGANILSSAKEVWKQANIIIKVKEPLSDERKYLREGLILYNYDHLSGDKELTLDLLKSKVDLVPFETVIVKGVAELLVPMSRIAGRRAAWFVGEDINGLNQRQRDKIRRQVRLFDTFNQYFDCPDLMKLEHKEVMVLGGGFAGMESAEMLARMGAQVIIIEINARRRKILSKKFGQRKFKGKVSVMDNPLYRIKKPLREDNIARILKGSNDSLSKRKLSHKEKGHIKKIIKAFDRAAAIIDAVYIRGARAPRVVDENLLRGLSGGKVIVDVSIDQGGGVEFINSEGESTEKITTPNRPVAVDKFGNRHYRVPNIPGSTPRVASLMLEDVTVFLKGRPYLLTLAQLGYEGAVKKFPELGRGMTKGHLTDKVVARDLGFRCS